MNYFLPWFTISKYFSLAAVVFKGKESFVKFQFLTGLWLLNPETTGIFPQNANIENYKNFLRNKNNAPPRKYWYSVGCTSYYVRFWKDVMRPYHVQLTGWDFAGNVDWTRNIAWKSWEAKIIAILKSVNRCGLNMLLLF